MSYALSFKVKRYNEFLGQDFLKYAVTGSLFAKYRYRCPNSKLSFFYESHENRIDIAVLWSMLFVKRCYDLLGQQFLSTQLQGYQLQTVGVGARMKSFCF